MGGRRSLDGDVHSWKVPFPGARFRLVAPDHMVGVGGVAMGSQCRGRETHVMDCSRARRCAPFKDTARGRPERPTVLSVGREP